MSKCKRALSLLLVMLMALSLFPASALAADGRGTYSVVINYVFTDGTQAAPDWVATVAAGSAINRTVSSPTVVGYTADKTTVVLKESAVNSDIKVTVTYSPAEVKYTVKHYQQNVDNDNYTLALTEEKTGLTDSKISAGLKKSYPGFTALNYDTDVKIAADGSTVVEIYYDRNYYLIKLDLDGGFGAEPVYARYGAPVSVANPTKPGYTFDGWSPAIPATMPDASVTHKAQWKADASAKVTVVIWGENADDEDYSYYESIETTGTPGESFNASGIAHPPLDQTSYGITGSETTPEDEAVKYFTKLGLESGKIYYFDDNGSSSNGDKYYLYLNGKYYEYSSKPTAYLGDELANTKCSGEGFLHTTDYFYKYNVKATTDSTLWRLVLSETPTVAADGTTVVNVKYDRVEKTLHFRKANSSTDDYGTITAKWGANIDADYKAVLSKASNNSFWSENRNGSGPYTNYIGIMPPIDKFYYNSGSSGSDGTMSYYFEDLNGSYPSTPGFSVSGVGGYTVTVEDRYEFEGFTYDHGTAVDSSCSGAAFYYTRNSYKLTFVNGGETVKSETVKFEQPLNSYSDFIPTMPSLYPAGSHVFAGWYLNPECTGEEYKLDEHTMPADNVLLYAKWTPVTHTLTFAKTEGEAPEHSETVPHGDLAPEYTTSNGVYTFIGWFYKDENGVEHAFDLSMPVVRDMTLYAKWRTDAIVTYTIHYQLADGTPVADDTVGSALALTTKTFEAKTGENLYADYQTGYFPDVSSHSILMDANGTNEFTFIYTPVEKVKYTVRYLDKDTNEPLIADKHGETSAAIITEKFEYIEGYAADAYQKRLVLSSNEEENVLIFWYVKDTVHAPVQIIHWVQNITGDGYTEYQSSAQQDGVIGKDYKADWLEIEGFHKNVDKSNPEGKLTNQGLVLNLYYDRDLVNYTFRFVDKLTNEEIHTSISGSARFGATVGQNALDIPGYKLADGTPDYKSITVSLTEAANQFTFYYVAYFNVVHVKDKGANSNTSEIIFSQSVKDNGYSLTDNVTSGYLYGGAFADAACATVYPFENGETGISFSPKPGATYYIWEVDQKYLAPKTFCTWLTNDSYQKEVVGLYLLTSMDRLLYREAGFTIGGTDYTEKASDGSVAYGDIRVTYSRTPDRVDLLYLSNGMMQQDTYYNGTTKQANDGGYIAAYELTAEQFAAFKTVPFTFHPYWITLDGVKVTSVSNRTCTYVESSTRIDVENSTVGSSCTAAESTSTQMSFVQSYFISADPTPVEPVEPTPTPDPVEPSPEPTEPVDPEPVEPSPEPTEPVVDPEPVEPPVDDSVVITVNDNGSSREVSAKSGDSLVGQIAYTGSYGKLFAGWFTDESCTTPAYLGCVTEDMTIYAKYVSDSFLRTKFAQQRWIGSEVFLFTAVDSYDYAEVGFLVNGEAVPNEYMGSQYSMYSARALFGSGVGRNAILVVGSYSADELELGSQLTITPYWVTMDGTTVCGTARTLTCGRYGLSD